MTVSFDVNLRRRLWSDEAAAPVLRPLARAADVVLGSPDELAVVTGTDDDDPAALAPRRPGPRPGARGRQARRRRRARPWRRGGEPDLAARRAPIAVAWSTRSGPATRSAPGSSPRGSRATDLATALADRERVRGRGRRGGGRPGRAARPGRARERCSRTTAGTPSADRDRPRPTRSRSTPPTRSAPIATGSCSPTARADPAGPPAIYLAGKSLGLQATGVRAGHGGAARPLGAPRGRGLVRAGRPVVHLRRDVPRADGADRRGAAVRGGDPQHADRQPPPDAGLVLPAGGRAATDPDRRAALPVRPARPRQPPRVARARPGRRTSWWSGHGRARTSSASRTSRGRSPSTGRRLALVALRRRQLRDRPGPADRAADGGRARGGRGRRLAARPRGREPAARPPRRRRRLRRVVHVQVPQRRPGLGRVDLRPRAPLGPGADAAAARRAGGARRRTTASIRTGRSCADTGAAAWKMSTSPLFNMVPLAASLAIFDEVGHAGPARALDPPDRLSRRAPRATTASRS